MDGSFWLNPEWTLQTQMVTSILVQYTYTINTSKISNHKLYLKYVKFHDWVDQTFSWNMQMLFNIISISTENMVLLF